MSGLVFFAGAGYSKWACGLPLVHELFDFNIFIRNMKEKENLNSIKQLKSEWDKHHPGINPELFIDSLRGQPSYKLIVWYISRRISDAFLARSLNGLQTLQIDQKAKWENKGIVRSREFLMELGNVGLRSILTTNYDLLVEYSLGTDSFYYDQDIRTLKGRGKNPYFPTHGSDPELNGSIKLLKLHGSLSWGEDGTRYTDSRCGLTGKGLIIAPIKNKTGIGQLKNIWNESEGELRQADKIVFFGFAFNPIDENILSILRKQILPTSEIYIINKNFNEKYIESLFPNNKILYIFPPDETSDIGQYTSVFTN